MIATEYRGGLARSMTNEQTPQYAIESVLRAAIREEFESYMLLFIKKILTYIKEIKQLSI
jgi:hypothetical protein